MKKVVLYIFLFVFSGIHLLAQDVNIARWKNDANAAYAVVIDGYATDYFDDIDTIRPSLSNKELTASFATIANWPACDSLCRHVYFDLAANELLSVGNEFINHSWDADSTNQDNIGLQIDSSKAVIENNIPGSQCLFYAFPKGFKKENGFLDTLRNRAFIGSRTNMEGNGINPHNFVDPFLLQSKFYNGAEGVTGLNQFVEDAISSGGFALRSCHNIGEGGTEPMAISVWKGHLDHCKQKVDSNIIWMAGVQRIIKYAMERENFIVSSQAAGDSLVYVFFDTETNEINPSSSISNAIYDEELTLLLSMPGEDTVKCNADPWGDTVVVRVEDGVIVKVMQDDMLLYPEPYLSVSADTFSVNCKTGGFSFYIHSNIDWNISSTGSWLHPSTLYGYGSGTVMVSHDANQVEEKRTDSIIISANQAQTVTLIIRQDSWQSVQELSLKKLNVYPCPADDYIHVACDRQPPFQLQIFDINGINYFDRMILSSPARLDVSFLPGGFYFLKIIGSDIILTSKFIVKN